MLDTTYTEFWLCTLGGLRKLHSRFLAKPEDAFSEKQEIQLSRKTGAPVFQKNRSQKIGAAQVIFGKASTSKLGVRVLILGGRNFNFGKCVNLN